jgi:translation initiation factor IF-2
MAKLLVRTGTLHPGDVIVCGAAHGRVKAMYDTLNPRQKYEAAGPSTPVNVTGLDIAPGAGDRFYVLNDITQARQLAEQRASEARQRELGNFVPHVTLETLYERLGQDAKVQTLNIIIRADVRGSIEAIRKELSKLQHPEVHIKILQATVGGISEADIHLAHASDAIVIGFSVVPDEGARALAEKLGVQIRRYDIIYQVTDELKAALVGMLKPEKQEKELGRALVQQVFHISRVGTVAGCRVLGGTIARDGRARLIRESRVLGDYAIETLKREKDDAREVREGFECGIKLAGFNDLKQGDLLEVYKIEEIARTF